MTSSSKDGATPSKMQKELEAKEAKTSTSTGPSEAALLKAQFELYEKDLPEVQEVRAQILGLDEGAKNFLLVSLFLGYSVATCICCPKCALVLGNGSERFCASRPLLGSYVHQESI